MRVACAIASRTVAAILVIASSRGFSTRAQEADRPEQRAFYQRKVQIPPREAFPAVVTTEFFTHGELDEKADTLAVYDARHEPVPWRVLQAGPGDYFRIAFQTAPRQHLYKIYYGPDAPKIKPPAWTSSAGLLLETRRWSSCDLNSRDAVRSAFQAASSYGMAFVPSVYHRHNPFEPAPEAFLSDYRGALHISKDGLYRFFTSSQDASFLSIDGKLVVAAPGWHGPVGDARFKGEVHLASGSHSFEYLHAAAGPDACMVAAWQPPGAPKPEMIPPEVFGSESVARLPALAVKHPREFVVETLGEVPMAEGEVPMVRVQFHLVAPQMTASRRKIHWDFGDGQSGNQPDPVHIYLHPGLYTVTMRVAGEADPSAVVNRVPVQRALVFSAEPDPADNLAAYLAIVARYDPAKLDPAGLLQLVRAFDRAGSPARAARAGQAGFRGRRTINEASGLELARAVGALFRDRLDDPDPAMALWQAAAAALQPEPWKAECEIEAADIALDDLHKPETARKLLDSASARMTAMSDARLLSRLNRVTGDWYARKGDRSSAMAAYARAMAALGASRTAVEQQAWRGALSRSTEEFLRDRSLDRARAELRRWQDEYPIDKVEGYLTFLRASWWSARGKYPQAIATAGDLLAINPDSPYADRLVFLSGECEEKLGHNARAQARFQSLLNDYPGSPLVGEARDKLAAPAKKPTVAKKRS
jgi:TolA-binding protein